MKKNSIKNIRINEEVRKVLAEELRLGVKDPSVHPFTSVMACDVATDLKTCKVYVSVLGTEKELSDTLEGLKRASGYLRRQLAHTLNLRNTPELSFIGDTSIAYGVNMTKKIDEVTKDDVERHVSDEWDQVYESYKEEESGII